jgi:hypothetical protein
MQLPETLAWRSSMNAALTLVLALAATPAALSAQQPHPLPPHVRHELRFDRRELRQDQRELRQDRRELVSDRRQHEGARELRQDRRELRDDHRDLRGDSRDLRHDVHRVGGLR